MAFRTVLQHGLGNPIVVEDDEDEVEIVEDSEPGREVLIEEMTPVEIREVREMTPRQYAGCLVLIDEIEVEEGEVWEDERMFRRDRPSPRHPENCDAGRALPPVTTCSHDWNRVAIRAAGLTVPGPGIIKAGPVLSTRFQYYNSIVIGWRDNKCNIINYNQM